MGYMSEEEIESQIFNNPDKLLRILIGEEIWDKFELGVKDFTIRRQVEVTHFLNVGVNGALVADMIIIFGSNLFVVEVKKTAVHSSVGQLQSYISEIENNSEYRCVAAGCIVAEKFTGSCYSALDGCVYDIDLILLEDIIE